MYETLKTAKTPFQAGERPCPNKKTIEITRGLFTFAGREGTMSVWQNNTEFTNIYSVWWPERLYHAPKKSDY